MQQMLWIGCWIFRETFQTIEGAVCAGCIAVLHGNSQHIPEETHTSAAHVVLK